MSEQEKFFAALNDGRVYIEATGYVQESGSFDGPHTGKYHEHRKFKIVVEPAEEEQEAPPYLVEDLQQEGLFFLTESEFRDIFGMEKWHTIWYEPKEHGDYYVDFVYRVRNHTERFKHFREQLSDWSGHA